MFCPTCGHRQNSAEIRFCSKCGFLLTGISQVVHNKGILPQPKKFQRNTPRSKGIRKGIFIFLMSFLVVPLSFVLSVAADNPLPTLLTAFLIFAISILRIGYAVLFESNVSDEEIEAAENRQYNLTEHHHNMDIPLLFPDSVDETRLFSSPAMGKWKDSNDLIKEPAVHPKKTRQL